jgi:hypothetical protein
LRTKRKPRSPEIIIIQRTIKQNSGIPAGAILDRAPAENLGQPCHLILLGIFQDFFHPPAEIRAFIARFLMLSLRL